MGEDKEVALTLRAMTDGDAETLAAWQTDPAFCANAGWRPSESRQQSVAWWQKQISDPDPQLVRLLALEGCKPVGYVDLHGSARTERELGYVIAPSALWGRGLGTAAARAGLEFGFTVLGLRRVWAEAVEANSASVSVLRRLGMRVIGIGSEEDFLGKTSRYLQFEISSREWHESRGTNAPK